MVKISTWLTIGDATSIKWLQVFHLYKGFHRKSSKIGYFAKGSAKVVTPPRLEYQGFKSKHSIKGDIARVVLVTLSYNYPTLAGLKVISQVNRGAVIKKKNNLKSKYLLGFVQKSIKRKKYKTLYKVVL